MNSDKKRLLTCLVSAALLYGACDSDEPIQPDNGASSSGAAGASTSAGGAGGASAGAPVAGAPTASSGGQTAAGEAGQAISPGGSAGDGGSSGAGGGASPVAGAGGAGQGGQDAGGKGGEGQAGSGGQATGAPCPTGLAGPKLIQVSTPGAKTYCVDQTEVTQGQYKQFLVATKNDVSGQDGECQKDISHEPFVGDDFGVCSYDFWTPDKTPERAVVCIGPCDAIAYCKWAGKHLCGKVGGGPVKLDKEKIEQGDEAALAVLNDPNNSQLYNACSQGGKTTYPYGSDKQANVCPSQAVDQDVATSACHGTEAPFDQIINLAGGVAEWEWTEPAIVGDSIVARGLNNFGKEEDEKNGRCDVPAFMAAGKDVGFRCCLDPD